jgi:tRNA (uracil-5-)-methyltransferase TRM9
MSDSLQPAAWGYNKPVDTEVAAKLLALNHQFYQTMGENFSATRLRLQPGVQRILDTIPRDAHILDLGCGNGELARRLEEGGFTGQYTGLDNSQTLLDIARKRTSDNPAYRFLLVDIADPGWDTGLETGSSARFDIILAFSVLHHLPGSLTRLHVLRKVRRIIQPDGRFVHSEWQFLNSPRLRERILPWEEVNISPAQVDQGDYLLDWRGGGYGLRYVHHFSEDELTRLAEQAGFSIEETYFSDGEQGNLGLYQTWLPRLT